MINKKHVRIIDFVFVVGTLLFILAGIYFVFYYNSGIMLAPPAAEQFFTYEANDAHIISILDSENNQGTIIVSTEGTTRLFSKGTYYLDFGKSGVARFTFEQAVSLEFARVDDTHFGVFSSEGVIDVGETRYTSLGEFDIGKSSFGGVNG
jgi:hypothetical protein